MTQADRELGMCCINRFLADWFNYSRLGYGQRLFLPTIEHICSNIYLFNLYIEPAGMRHGFLSLYTVCVHSCLFLMYICKYILYKTIPQLCLS